MSAAPQLPTVLMTIADVAAFLRVSTTEVVRLAMRQGLPCVPESLRFDRNAVMAWFDGLPRGPNPVATTPAISWPSAPDIVPMDPPETGGVYAIGATTGHVKIGKTWNFRRRLNGLQGANPFPLMLLAILSNDESEEREFHQMFADHRLSGEWFSPHQEVIAAIRDARRIW